MTGRHWCFGCVLFTLIACGGGGGGSGGNNSPSNPPGGGGGGTGGGGTGGSGGGTGGGGTGGGGGTIITGGLTSGGVALVVDTNQIGVGLDVAVGGTGMVMGDIQRFSSVIANDITTNTDNADFIVEGVSGNQADLQQGQQVLVIGDVASNTAAQVLYRSNVRGPATSVTFDDVAQGTATFTVFGQTVTTDATTTFANVNLADILVNDLLEISGTVDVNGEIQASYVELKASLALYKVTGQTSGVTATDFILGNLTIDYSNATLTDFANSAIANGDIVEAKGLPTDFTAPSQFTATEIERLPILTLGGDAIVRVEGFIDRFVSATDFDVQTTPITTDANTIFANGDTTSLALQVKVQIQGTATGSGPMLAESITIQSTNTVRTEGNVEAIDTVARTVTSLGVTFTIRDLTQFEDDSSANVDPLALEDLGIGDELEIRGYLDGSTVVATRVERDDNRDRARLRGPVTAENAAAGTVDILDVTVTGQSGITQFEDINDTIITQTEFHDDVELGDFVRARWDVFSNTNEIVDELSIEDE